MRGSGPWPTPHSPGPWVSQDTDEGEWVVDILDDGKVSVLRLYFGDMGTNTGTDIANANLVAAAPDLLAAVLSSRAASSPASRRLARRWADEAIAKATGGEA